MSDNGYLEVCTRFADAIRAAGNYTSVEVPKALLKTDADGIIADVLREKHDAQPERVKILHEGAALTFGPRDAEYGPPAINFACAAEMKQLARKHARRDISPAEWEALDMMLTKLGRALVGKPKRDTYVDGATYFAIAGEIALSSLD